VLNNYVGISTTAKGEVLFWIGLDDYDKQAIACYDFNKCFTSY
jgi:hypothetical protein